jgi:LysR family hydrogen peroxide-inducible transcriptional activator
MHFTLKQMAYLVALSETRHFGRAAERCHVTQPALSQQLRLIEERCGSPVFDRLGRSLELTPFGRELVERARAVLLAAEQFETVAAGAGGGPSRPLRFGLIPTVAPYLLPEVFPALAAGFPELTFTVSESRTDTLLEGLADGDIDLALIAAEPRGRGPRLASEPLFADPFVLATCAAEAPAGPVALATLETSRMLLLDEGHCLREQAIAACGLDRAGATRAFAATSLSTIVEFVANGQGITLLPAIALRKEAIDPRIRIAALASPGAGRRLHLVWREQSPFATLFHDIAETIREAHRAARRDQASRYPALAE